MYDKEKIYDEQIAPLITQIIEICKKNEISIFTNFYLKEATDEENDMYCTTCLPGKYQTQMHKDLYNVAMNNYIVNKPLFISTTIYNK